MNMPLRTTDPVVALPAATAKLLAIPTKQVSLASRVGMRASQIAVRLIPPTVVIATTAGDLGAVVQQPWCVAAAPFQGPR